MTETSKHFLGANARTWWTLVICIAVSSIATWFAIDHANANDRRSQRKANQQFQHALILSNRKFQQAIRISSAQAAYSTNKSVCGFRTLLKPATEDTRTTGARRRQLKSFLDNEVTVPPDFNCAKLPKKPPK